MAGPNVLNIANKVNFLSSSPMTLPKATTNPGSAVAGDFYYNSTDNTIHYYNGSTWVSISASSLTGQALTSGNIIVGNGSNLSASVAMSGDVVIDNTGATTIVATTNSSLTTLSALSLPTSQLSGMIDLTTQVSGILPAPNGGTGFGTYAVGDLLYASSTSALSRLAVGTNGYVLTLSAGLPVWSPAGSTGANTALSNLITTNINQDLIFNTGANATIKTRDEVSTTVSKSIMLASGTTVDGNSGDIRIQVGNPTGAGSQGVIYANGQLRPELDGNWQLGDPTATWTVAWLHDIVAPALNNLTIKTVDTGGSGAVLIYSGAGTGGGSGLVQVSSGDADQSTGQLVLKSGDTSSSTDGTGSVSFSSGLATSSSGQTGFATMFTGDSDSGNSGDVEIFSGSSNTGNTGHILLETGGTGGGGVQGKIIFRDGSEGTANYIWTSSTTDGTGHWLAPSFLPLAGGTMTGNINMGAHSITNMAAPVNPNDAVTKAYVDNFINATSWKTAVLVATTANITLSGEQTIDGVTTSTSRVLVKNQTTTANNGIYVSASGSWTRAVDMDSWAEVPAAAVFVTSGTVNADLGFVCTAQPGGTLGSTAINFVQFSSAGSYTADNVTLQLISGVFSVKTNGIAYANIQQVAASKLLGNPTGGSANVSEITLGATLAFSGSALQTVAMTGDVTSSANSFATTVAKIQGTTVSGTTGSGNVVFSASPTLTGTITAAAANFSGALGANGGITSTGALLLNVNAGASALQIEALNVQRSTNGTNFVTETYVDSITLTDNSGPTAVTAFQFAVASFAGEEITYVIESGNANADRRVGTIQVTANGTGTIVPSIIDTYAESADTGVTWTATNSAGTISVNYTCTNQGANRTMRADCKFFRA